ncbi:gamma-glutamyl-gamma-aminobutyrate hydrolase family protein [Actinocatenispora rupis]|uniref:Gamma-glutamyl-gamma-aminobutyrate hydrolase n=1 Tax=Actinocatenispora rupis TaxID=519421 RepID=A0A8J3NEI2_9ACTN|nr:gamma-glutamyl-gamma-aminobutyrate hydrolase family protein [Actinocatenispora rupis]GID13985.1 gamma-glutamyl-gamma-aminobutyrate hydrolase [Actinocatenispora rupis]
MARPVVGVTGYIVDAGKARELGFGPRQLDVTPGTYLGWVRDSGMLPVPIPSHPGTLYHDYLDLVDGLLLTGGADIDPTRYDEPAHPLAKLEPVRDAFEFGLVRAALDRGLPILGICRGMQLLNVALGGTLHQHLPERSGELVHSSEFRDGRRHPDDMWVPAEHVVTVTDPELVELAGDTLTTNSYHHQGVARLGEGLRVAARADDGLVEAIVGVDLPVLGVQWHPEMHTGTESAGLAPFRWFARRLAAATEVLAAS